MREIHTGQSRYVPNQPYVGTNVKEDRGERQAEKTLSREHKDRGKERERERERER